MDNMDSMLAEVLRLLNLWRSPGSPGPALHLLDPGAAMDVVSWAIFKGSVRLSRCPLRLLRRRETRRDRRARSISDLETERPTIGKYWGS